jgi:hypothetical protein
MDGVKTVSRHLFCHPWKEQPMRKHSLIWGGAKIEYQVVQFERNLNHVIQVSIFTNIL